MLNTIMISSPITPVMANYIVHESPDAYKWYPAFGQYDTVRHSEDFRRMGIIDMNVWFNTRKMVSESFATPNCLLNVLLDAKFVTCMDDVIGEITALLPDYPQNYLKNFVTPLHFEVKSATFTYNFTGKLIKQYYVLLRGGYDLQHMNLQKTVSEDTMYDFNIHTTEYSGIHSNKSRDTLNRYNESLHIKIEHREKKRKDRERQKKTLHTSKTPDIEYTTDRIVGYPLIDPNKSFSDDLPEEQKATNIKAKERLQIKINTKRNKISRICHQMNFTDRDPDKFFANAAKIDSIVFHDYIKHITGMGRYYKYKDAEAIIDSVSTFPDGRKLTPKRKNRMKDVLKGVASYKAVSTYLNHVEDAEITYPCMASVRKRSVALTLLRELQSVGICPLNLSVRSEYKELDNLITVYEQATSDAQQS